MTNPNQSKRATTEFVTVKKLDFERGIATFEKSSGEKIAIRLPLKHQGWQRITIGQKVELDCYYDANSKLRYSVVLPDKSENQEKTYAENPTRTIKECCSKYNILCFYHITHIDNLSSILDKGILCKNCVGANRDISDAEIQTHRHRKTIPPYPDLTLHDYVPLFMAPKSPMLSVLRGVQGSIVYLHVDPQILSLPKVVFTDGNARSNATRFFTEINDFRLIDWELLKVSYWGSEDSYQHYENKRRRSAEVLIPGSIPLEYLSAITVMHDGMREIVEKILIKFESNLNLYVNPNFYFQPPPFTGIYRYED